MGKHKKRKIIGVVINMPDYRGSEEDLLKVLRDELRNREATWDYHRRNFERMQELRDQRKQTEDDQ